MAMAQCQASYILGKRDMDDAGLGATADCMQASDSQTMLEACIP